MGPVVGGLLYDPAAQYPHVFGGTFFEEFPTLLPCLVSGTLLFSFDHLSHYCLSNNFFTNLTLIKIYSSLAFFTLSGLIVGFFSLNETLKPRPLEEITEEQDAVELEAIPSTDSNTPTTTTIPDSIVQKDSLPEIEEQQHIHRSFLKSLRKLRSRISFTKKNKHDVNILTDKWVIVSVTLYGMIALIFTVFEELFPLLV